MSRRRFRPERSTASPAGWSWISRPKLGIKVGEPNLTRYDLFNADECFLTGTGAEMVPVVKIDGRVIGDGKPGPVTEQLGRSNTMP